MVMPTNWYAVFFCLFVFAVCPAGWKPGSDTVSIHEANTDKVLIILYIDEILSLDFLDFLQARLFQSHARNVGIQNEYL